MVDIAGEGQARITAMVHIKPKLGVILVPLLHEHAICSFFLRGESLTHLLIFKKNKKTKNISAKC